jgi:uncharacterized protein YndB with AHSA1/START domain
MRWLLYALVGVVGLIVVAILVLLAIGGGRGESHLEATIEIERPAAVVFPWLREPEKQKAWIGWLVDVRPVQTAGPDMSNGRDIWVMEDRNNNNQLMEIAVDVTRVEPPRLLEARLRAAAGFEGDVSYVLEELSPSRTRLTHKADYRFDHWLARLLEPVIRRSAQGKLEEDLARLKQRVEAEQP